MTEGGPTNPNSYQVNNGLRTAHSSHSLENIYYRLNDMENRQKELEKFSDELRLDRTTLLVNYTNLDNTCKRNAADIEKLQTASTDLSVLLNRRVDELREAITSRISETQAEFHARMNSLSTDVAANLQHLKDDITARLARDTQALSDKFDENRTYLNRAIIGLAFGIVVLFISIALSKWI